MNLYKEYKSLEKSKEDILSKKGILTLLFSTLLILSLALLTINIQRNLLVKKTQKMEATLHSEIFLKNYKKAKRQEEALTIGQELKLKLESINAVLHEKKSLDADFINDIKKLELAVLDLQSLSYSSGSVLVNYESKTVKESLDYTEKLRSMDLIKDLRYKGYKKNNNLIQGQLEILLEGGY